MILQRYFGQGKIEKLNKEFSYYRKKIQAFYRNQDICGNDLIQLRKNREGIVLKYEIL